MRKKYLRLTKEQKNRGIIFSSCLLPDEKPTIHEVDENDPKKDATIELLLDDKFFDDSPYKYNEIRR